MVFGSFYGRLKLGILKVVVILLDIISKRFELRVFIECIVSFVVDFVFYLSILIFCLLNFVFFSFL